MTQENFTYTYDRNEKEFIFHVNGEMLRTKTLAIMYEEDEPYDTYLKHGSKEDVEKLFLSEPYKRLTNITGLPIYMVEVKPEHIETLNKCLHISASKWCTKLKKLHEEAQ